NYLMFELYDGKRFEEQDNNKSQISNYIRNDFGRSKLVMSLASFDFKKSKEDIWTSHYYMKRINQLSTDIDSMDFNIFDAQLAVYEDAQSTSLYHLQEKVKIPDKYLLRKAFKDSVSKITNPDSLMAIKYGGEEFQQSAPANGKHSVEQDPAIPQVKVAKTMTLSDSMLAGKTVQPTPTSGAVIGKDRFTLKEGLANVSAIDPGVINKNKTTTLKKGEGAGKKKKINKPKPYTREELDSLFLTEKYQTQGIRNALTQARIAKNKLDVQLSKVSNQEKLIIKYKKEIHKKYAQAFACIVMFLIGAPLGAIIKKGGLGVPAIISIVVFIIYYVLSITGEKWADEGFVSPFLGVWGSDLILLPVGLLFLRQAKNDVRLLETDFYRVLFTKLRKRLRLKAA
ncbi:MAG: LptF/LptG family permease, partial [Cyclobacteriaceae bacterium]